MNIKKILSLTLVVIMLFCLCACADNEDSQRKNSSESVATQNIATSFSVTVVDGDDNPVEGVVLQLRKDSRVTARTNKAGIATFPIVVTDGYKLSVFSCPEGYEYTGKNSMPIEKGSKEFTVQISKK